MRDTVFAEVTTKVLNTRPFSNEFREAMTPKTPTPMKLYERIKEIESERERMRELLATRIEAAIADYREETGEMIDRIVVTGTKAKVFYRPEPEL